MRSRSSSTVKSRIKKRLAVEAAPPSNSICERRGFGSGSAVRTALVGLPFFGRCGHRRFQLSGMFACQRRSSGSGMPLPSVRLPPHVAPVRSSMAAARWSLKEKGAARGRSANCRERLPPLSGIGYNSRRPETSAQAALRETRQRAALPSNVSYAASQSETSRHRERRP